MRSYVSFDSKQFASWTLSARDRYLPFSCTTCDGSLLLSLPVWKYSISQIETLAKYVYGCYTIG